MFKENDMAAVKDFYSSDESLQACLVCVIISMFLKKRIVLRKGTLNCDRPVLYTGICRAVAAMYGCDEGCAYSGLCSEKA